MEIRNSPPMVFIFKQLEKYQIEYYPDNLNLISFSSHTSLQLLMFPISLIKRVWYHIENDKVLKDKLDIFHDVREIEIYFSYNAFASTVC